MYIVIICASVETISQSYYWRKNVLPSKQSMVSKSIPPLPLSVVALGIYVCTIYIPNEVPINFKPMKQPLKTIFLHHDLVTVA